MDGLTYLAALTKVYEMLQEFNPWLVGSGTDFFVNFLLDGVNDELNPPPDDIDLIIPKGYEDHPDLLNTIPNDHTFTSMGGYRFKVNGVQIDLWFDNVDQYIIEVPTAVEGIAINLATGARLCSHDYLTASLLARFNNLDVKECNYIIESRPVRKANPERFQKYLEEKCLQNGN
jgi:hypothetical protein